MGRAVDVVSEYRLFPRQREVESRLRAGSFVLNWYMRLGKTRACLHAFDRDWQAGGPSVLVVVCPAIAKGVWIAEQREMGLQLPIIKLDGIKKKRAVGERIRGLPLMVLINWEILDAHLADLIKLATSSRITLVLDETQDHCTNPANRRYKAAKDLSMLAEKVWICSGTLYRTSAMDFYWQLRLIGKANPWQFTKIKDFGPRFARERYNKFNDKIEYVGIHNEADMLAPCLNVIDRRLEELEELPEDFVWWLDEGDRYRYSAGDAPGAMSAARSALSDLKVARTVELVKYNHLEGGPLVVFGWHREFVKKCAAALGGAALYGDTSTEQKNQIVADFRAGKIPVVVANIRAAGVSIDLATARNAVFGEVDWVAATMEQAEARIRGPRQTERVTYWYVLCSDSVDEFIWRTQLRRAGDSRRIDEHLLSA